MKTDLFQPYTVTVDLLKKYAIPVAPAHLVATPQAAAAAAQALNAPVVLKIISAVESHKSDRGLLALNLSDPDQVREEAQRLLKKSANLPKEGLLVQKMAPPGVECLAGLHHDPQFGVMLALGAGGTLVELLDKVILRQAPVGAPEILWLLKQHPLFRLLQGYRGQPPADLDALCTMLANLSRLGADLGDRLVSLDINPAIAAPEGVQVVDFRLSMKGPKDDA